MKQITIILCLLLGSYFSFSQEKTEFGVSAEGAWFMPKRDTEYRGLETKNGFGTGVGVYASRSLFGKLSADVGLAYRFKQMEQHYSIYLGEIGGYEYTGETQTGYGYTGYDNSNNVEGWDKLPMHHLVVPLHLQLLLGKSFFVKGGIETTWLLNYEAVNEKPEFNWVLGLGSQKYKLKWSVNYIRGFKEQGFGDNTIEADGHYKGSINRNNMVQVKLSYPIWQLKQ